MSNCENELYTNSDQSFTTCVFDCDGLQLNAASFTGAEYRIFDLSCTTEFVSKSLGSGITVVGDKFKTDLTETDMAITPGEYLHQFKVINATAQTLPPIFEEQVTVNNVCKVP